MRCMCKKILKQHKVIDKPFIYESKEENKDNNIQNQNTYKYRLKITKENELRYISHLDWQNTQ